jgi:hypothetical protein
MRIEAEDGLAQDEDREKDHQHFGNHDGCWRAMRKTKTGESKSN